jgi:hypothetical protein
MELNNMKNECKPRTIVVARLRHKGKTYTVKDDFGPGFRPDWAERAWLTGSMKDSTNRSILIRQQCDPSFEVVPPWVKSIALIDVRAEVLEHDPIPEPPLVRETLYMLRQTLWPQEMSRSENTRHHIEFDQDYGAKRPSDLFEPVEKPYGRNTGVLRFLAKDFPKSNRVDRFTEHDMLNVKGAAR